MKTGFTRLVPRLLFLSLILNAAHLANAQFTEVDPGMAQPPFPCVAIGDYDNDSDLDVLIAGLGKRDVPFTIIYKNTGGVFADSGIVVPGLSRAAAAWGDFDGDGDLDLAMTGLTGAGVPTTRIYRNDGGVFTQLPVNLAPLFAGNVIWGDYDGDGDLDLLVTGVTSASTAGVAMTKLYRNDGGGVFSAVPQPFPDCYTGAAAWGDFDNDGKLDLVLAGALTGGGLTSGIWHNDGGGNFTKIDFALPAMDLGFAVWGDFDGDGDLDLLFGGNTDAGFVTTIYRNNGGTFTDIKPAMTPVLWASAAWGDYDNDGDLDAMVVGYDPVAQTSRSTLYRNNGDGTFSDSGATFHNIYLGTVAWLDYDNDGRLDLLMAGNESGVGDLLRLAHNDVATADSAPTAPANPKASFRGAETILSWDAGTDAQTPAPSLTYDVRVGTIPGGSDVIAAMSGTANRKLTGMGNAQLGVTFPIEGLAPGATYYWSVRSIDTAFIGSPFTAEATFVVPAPAQAASITQTASGAITMQWIVTPGLSYRVEVSSDLVNWSPLETVTPASGANTVEVTDTISAELEKRFYRLVFP